VTVTDRPVRLATRPAPRQAVARLQRVRRRLPVAALEGRFGAWLVAGALLACLSGVVAGMRSGPLWLDEALSVNIARLALFGTGPDTLFGGLRQDGAPPLYYVLLHGWTRLFGTGTVTVRVLSAVLTLLALALVHRLGERLSGCAAARAGVIVLAALPWTMRYGSETRMYMLVVVLVLGGAVALVELRGRAGAGVPTGAAQLALWASATGLLYTHYWSLFLLAAVGAALLPGLVRRGRFEVRAAIALAGSALAFTPWLPTFLFQSAHTGAPWAEPLALGELLRTPLYWGGGTYPARLVLGVVLLTLGVLAVLRVRALPVVPWGVRPIGAVTLGTLLLAFVAVYVGGGSYTTRYTAVVVPLLAVLAGCGALRLPGRGPALALTVLVVVGAVTGVRAAGNSRTDAFDIAAGFERAAAPGEMLAYCPDQLGPEVARLLGPTVPQRVYPTLAAPDRIDWTDYTARQQAADPAAVARQLSSLAGDRPMFLLSDTRYRTFEGQCEQVRDELARLRGEPSVVSRNGIWTFPSVPETLAPRLARLQGTDIESVRRLGPVRALTRYDPPLPSATES